MNKEKLLQDLGYGILLQLGEGPCTAGCEICYERPAAITHLTTKGLISLGSDAPDNKHLAGILAQHPELGLRMPLPQIQETFRLLKAAGIGRVSLAGSEPTDHPQFKEILDAANKESLQVRIYTSGLHHKKMFHPALRVIVLHLDYRQCGVQKGLQMVREGIYPDPGMMESIKALIDSGVEIQLRINFESHEPLGTPEWGMITNFYGQLTPNQRKKVMLKYSFTVRVHGEESLWHATPEGMKASSKAITDFVDLFRSTFDAPMLSERTLFRCAFPDEVWNEYSRTGGFRSMCNMELTYYWQNGQTVLGFCPPARTLVQPYHVTSVNEFWQALSLFHDLFDRHNRVPAFPVCTNCELRGRNPNDQVVCQGGCLGGKATALVQLG